VDEIEIGQQVFFRLRFNRQGPVAVSVHLKPSGWEPSVMALAEAGVAVTGPVAAYLARRRLVPTEVGAPGRQPTPVRPT
jgi:hypothetical protein